MEGDKMGGPIDRKSMLQGTSVSLVGVGGP